MKIAKVIPIVLLFIIFINPAFCTGLPDWLSLDWIAESIMYPNADKNIPGISENINLTVQIYKNQCTNDQIKEITNFEDQIGEGKIRINLRNFGLTFREFEPIFYSLRINKTVVYLVLDGNFIGDVGAKMLSDLLNVNNTIKTVEFRNCSIADKGKELLKKTISDKSNKINLIDLDKKSPWEDNVNIYLNSCYNNNLPVYKKFLNFFRIDRKMLRIPYKFEDNLTIPYDLIFFNSTYLIDTDTNDLNYDSIVLGDLIRNSLIIDSVYITQADFSNIDAGYFFDSFTYSSNLKSLIMNKSTFGDKNAGFLFSRLNKSYIEAFHVINCIINDNQMDMLSKMISDNHRITNFYFRDDENFSEQAFSKLINVLCYSNNTIQYLSITGKAVDNDPDMAVFNKKFPENEINR